MDKRFKTGKQPYDAAKDTQATALSPKSLDFVRLSSESTRENPRLLGGTLQEAQDYYNKLDRKDRIEDDNFKNMKAKNGTEEAKERYPLGHKIYLEYMKNTIKTIKDVLHHVYLYKT